jgi:hypothetical protein
MPLTLEDLEATPPYIIRQVWEVMLNTDGGSWHSDISNSAVLKERFCFCHENPDRNVSKGDDHCFMYWCVDWASTYIEVWRKLMPELGGFYPRTPQRTLRLGLFSTKHETETVVVSSICSFEVDWPSKTTKVVTAGKTFKIKHTTHWHQEGLRAVLLMSLTSKET